MIETTIQEVSLQDLGQLPMRARVAFAVRCAARVRSRWDRIEMPDEQRQILNAAMRCATDYAHGQGEMPPDIDDKVKAVYQAAEEVIDHCQYSAFSVGHALQAAAQSQFVKSGDHEAAWEVMAAAYGGLRVLLNMVSKSQEKQLLYALWSDYSRLVALNLGTPQEVGGPVETSEAGPLGVYWPPPPQPQYAPPF